MGGDICMQDKKKMIAETSNQLGFTTLENELVVLDGLFVRGKIPSWLSGTLIRNGPAKFEVGRQKFNHWFDGLAMLHKFSFTDGKVLYANKFLNTRAYKKAKESGKISFSEFATDPCRSIFSRVSAMFSRQFTDNTNVNITRIANKFIAMTETPIPVEFDPRTLETVGVMDYNDDDDNRISGQVTTAHPHFDFSKNETINYMTHLSRESSYNIYRISSGRKQQQRELIASVKVNEPSYMHSFGLTEHYIILVEFPLVINPLDILVSGKPFAENLLWKPEKGTKFTIVDRTNGRVVGSYQSEPFFAFHHVNSFETENNGIVVDIVAYPDSTIVRSLYLDVLRGDIPGSIPASQLRRYYISPSSGSVEFKVLHDDMLELPRINYRKYNMKDYDFIYAAGTYSVGNFTNRLIKIDVKNRNSRVWTEKGCHPGEPVFVPRPDSVQEEEEDDGVVLSVVLDSNKGNSFLLVLDAKSFEEVARAEVPHHIPFGFHGQYYGDIK
jgi:beta,beta-carotene 9',10'-dioxygenase